MPTGERREIALASPRCRMTPIPATSTPAALASEASGQRGKLYDARA